MKKSALILLLGLLTSTLGFAGFYYFGTASCRTLMSQPQPELAWLKKEFHLSDSEFGRIVEMHEAYLPKCGERCALIAKQDNQLRESLATATTMTPEIQNLLMERARMRAECETEMLRHFLAVSRTMPPDQGQRYLAWVESQCCLQGQLMEQQHKTSENSEHHHH